MTGKTTIEWATAVWNPTTGCTRVSAGCDNCYAFALHDKRYKSNLDAAHEFMGEHPDALELGDKAGQSVIATTRFVTRGQELPWPQQYDLPFSRVQLLPDRLEDPLRHRKPERYFVDSMSDLFHEDVPDEYIARVWGTMESQLAAHHRFLILTKRPERMAAWVQEYHRHQQWVSEGTHVVPTNVWLGTSVEDQASADERIPHLLATPAAVRFLSCEPLLGPVDIRRWSWGDRCPDRQCGDSTWDHNCELGEQLLHWVIVGGESGPRARPMDLAWARSLVAQCRAAGVTPFVKQLGSRPTTWVQWPDEWARDGVHAESAVMHLREPHGRDMDEWPDDLRIREFPR
jgi:protein gp37